MMNCSEVEENHTCTEILRIKLLLLQLFAVNQSVPNAIPAVLNNLIGDYAYLFCFFCSCDLAHVAHVAVYGLDRGSSMSASPFDYLFHTIVIFLLLFFKTARLDNVHGCCSLVGS
jgi:hypothetical protein